MCHFFWALRSWCTESRQKSHICLRSFTCEWCAQWTYISSLCCIFWWCYGVWNIWRYDPKWRAYVFNWVEKIYCNVIRHPELEWFRFAERYEIFPSNPYILQVLLQGRCPLRQGSPGDGCVWEFGVAIGSSVFSWTSASTYLELICMYCRQYLASRYMLLHACFLLRYV